MSPRQDTSSDAFEPHDTGRTEAAHVPVLLDAFLERAAPVRGVWLDGTLGAGGYTRALLDAGATRVIALDRDPAALALAQGWAPAYGSRLSMIEGRFSELLEHARRAAALPLDGVVLDIGVSSMQLDTAERGFSFLRDGPLDMRMGAEGPGAAEVVNTASESEIADILFQYGEERASRRIARAIVAARAEGPIETTARLAAIVAATLPGQRPGQAHPATRSFQALRIHVNDELGELVAGLVAAEAALAPDGVLAVVTFHSLEDRIVKRFLQARSGEAPRASRHAPEIRQEAPAFAKLTRSAVTAEAGEIASNPRARSARLRMARRTTAPARPTAPDALGLPRLARGAG